MGKYKESDNELLLLLLRMGEETSPIRLSIGTVVNGIVQPGIILHEAAPFVINTLIQRGYKCSLTEDGMRVYKL